MSKFRTGYETTVRFRLQSVLALLFDTFAGFSETRMNGINAASSTNPLSRNFLKYSSFYIDFEIRSAFRNNVKVSA